jgi:predicted ATPase/DNA-binding winged helix-turn-helix (wHTH) protein
VQGEAPRLVYVCGEWTVDLAQRELRRRGVGILVGSRALDVLQVLMLSAGKVITKEELLARVWPERVVEENTLQVQMSAIRKAFGPDRRMVQTVSGRGYRLLGDWTAQAEPSASVLAGAAQRPPSLRFSGNLLIGGPDLIGRNVAVQHLKQLLSGHRIVTLTGPGGIGKTTLAREVARGLLTTFQGDVWFVELGSLAESALLPTTVAGTVGLELGGHAISNSAVARAIGDRKILLVLDNCEHVVESTAGFVEETLRACQHASILATSREILRVAEEFVYGVPPLDVPPVHQEASYSVLEHSAVQLFAARTKALGSDFALQERNFPLMAAICRRLDGIPLAIEFAAARAGTLGLADVALRLDHRFALLAGARRTALPRHQTLQATLDWSYRLLPDTEQYLLRHLAVFAAGFTLKAAIAIMRDISDAATVIECTANLVSKSLVTLDSSALVTRWRLLETIRSYSLEKLVEGGEATVAARRQAQFFRDFFSSASLDTLAESAKEVRDHYGRELDNIRAALDWSFSPTGDAAIGVALAAAYIPGWLQLSLVAECRSFAERALACITPGSTVDWRVQMQLYLGLGTAVIYLLEPVEKARAALTAAVKLAAAMSDVDAQLQTFWAMWVLLVIAGECREARTYTERFARVALEANDYGVVLVARRLMSYDLQSNGTLIEAQQHIEYVLAHFVAPKDHRYSIWLQLDQRILARAMLARILWLRGFPDQAMERARFSLEEAKATGNKLSVCEALRLAVCPVSLSIGDLATAEQGITMLIEIATSTTATFWKIVGRCLVGALLIRRGEYEVGSNILHTELNIREITGWAIWYPQFMGVLAEGLAGLGLFSDALEAVDRALTRADGGGESYYVPELYRIKGEIHLGGRGDDPTTSAENCFREGISVAQRQGALFWELRIAISLARLRIRQGRHESVRDVLAPVYNRFTEGFGTADLSAAKAILNSLP